MVFRRFPLFVIISFTLSFWFFFRKTRSWKHAVVAAFATSYFTISVNIKTIDSEPDFVLVKSSEPKEIVVKTNSTLRSVPSNLSAISSGSSFLRSKIGECSEGTTFSAEEISALEIDDNTMLVKNTGNSVDAYTPPVYNGRNFHRGGPGRYGQFGPGLHYNPPGVVVQTPPGGLYTNSGTQARTAKPARLPSGFNQIPHKPSEKQGFYGGATGLGSSGSGSDPSGSGSDSGNDLDRTNLLKSADECKIQHQSKPQKKKKNKNRVLKLELEQKSLQHIPASW